MNVLQISNTKTYSTSPVSLEGATHMSNVQNLCSLMISSGIILSFRSWALSIRIYCRNPVLDQTNQYSTALGTLVEITVPAHAHGIGKHTSRSSRQTGAVTLYILTEMQKHSPKVS